MIVFNNVMNIPFSVNYLDMCAYRSIAADEASKIFHYDKSVFGASTLFKKNVYGQTRLSIPQRAYKVLAHYLSTTVTAVDGSYKFVYTEMTVGDVYMHIPRLSLIHNCGIETARTILSAFILLRNRVSDVGVALDISNLQEDVSSWRCRKRLHIDPETERQILLNHRKSFLRHDS